MSKEPKSKIERLWQHRGLFCLALAIPLGHRCGYVRVPDDHEWKDIIDTEQLARYEEHAREGMTLPGAKDPGPFFLSIYNDPKKRERLAREAAWGDKISVHGGVTFLDDMTSDGWEKTVEGGDGIPGGLWIGFDCAHAWDDRDPEILKAFGPKHAALYAALVLPMPNGVIRTLEYVVSECENMADQILAAHVLDEVAALVNGKEIDDAIS